MAKKTLTQKMTSPAAPEIKTAPEMWANGNTNATMLIPTPAIIKELVDKIPEGKVLTTSQLRQELSKEHHTDITCPLTTGIFLRVVAEFSEEQAASGKGSSPWWRVVKDGGKLNDKLPGFPARQAELLQSEGYDVDLKKNKVNI